MTAARSIGGTILEVDAVSLAFGGVKALTEVSFDVREHEIRAIIGPNGAGKSSMLNVINGVYRPQRGTITFRGVPRHGMNPYDAASSGIARTFQNIALFKGMSVLDNIMTGRNLKMHAGFLAQAVWYGPALKEEIEHRRVAEQIIDFLQIEAVRKTPVGRLPYGLQKRVELGRALAAEPRLLLLDEPASGLTAEEKEEVAYWLHEARGRFRLTLLFVEHDLRFASRLATRMVALDRGEKIAEGTPDEVQRRPEVARAYLGD